MSALSSFSDNGPLSMSFWVTLLNTSIWYSADNSGNLDRRKQQCWERSTTISVSCNSTPLNIRQLLIRIFSSYNKHQNNNLQPRMRNLFSKNLLNNFIFKQISLSLLPSIFLNVLKSYIFAYHRNFTFKC